MQPAYQFLIYPATLALANTASSHRFAEGYFLHRQTMTWFSNQYIKDQDPRDPGISPLLAPDLNGVAPAYVMVAGHDPLRDEGVAYANRLKQAGVPATLVEYPGQIHGFISMAGLIPEGRAALRAGADAVRRALLAPTPVADATDVSA